LKGEYVFSNFNPLPAHLFQLIKEDFTMCCFFTSLLFFGPRLAFLVYWLFKSVKVTLAFEMFNFPWLVGIMGLIFAPWTTLMYVIVFPLNGFDWIWLGFGIFADIFSYVGGFHNRQKVPYYAGP
jgi:hypothetical protein